MTSPVLLISGSTRAASTNSALLRTAAAIDPSCVYYAGLGSLPHFNPDDDHEPLPASVAELRTAIGMADAVLICTPEYAGTLPGAMKNLLDWTVGGTELTGKPVAWVNAAADGRRGHGAITTLETVLGYVQASLVRTGCRHIPVAHEVIGADGLVADPQARAALADAVGELRAAALSRSSSPRHDT